MDKLRKQPVNEQIKIQKDQETIEFLKEMIKSSKERQKDLIALRKKFQKEYPEIFK